MARPKKVKEESDTRYVIELTTTQCHVVERALDLYSRVLAGEIDEVASTLRCHFTFTDEKSNPIPWDNIKILEDCLGGLKALLGLPRNGNHGIYSHCISDDARKAYDILKALAYYRYHNESRDLDEDQRRWCHWFDVPTKTSTDAQFSLPLVKVK